MRWLRWVFVVYLGAVLWLTMWPSLDSTAVPGWAQATVDFLGGLGIDTSVAALEMGSNVVMFVPFGLLGVLLTASARPIWSPGAVLLAVAVAGFVFSAAIETTQLAIPGRVSTLQDVVLNGVGGLAGALAGVALLRPAGVRARRDG